MKPKTENLSYLTATALLDLLAKKVISAADLLEHTIKRIEQYDDKINAVVVRDFDEARKSAVEADKLIARGTSLPLLGLPMTVKECFDVKGLTTTWGHPQFKNYTRGKDALTVTRLKKAGAIIVGKTNVPFMLKDWQSENAIYGRTNNPYDLSLTPGGSSGGSAAALSAGFVSLELGSDLAGSLRVPAHFCGVFAHRPTQGLIPQRGAQPPGILASSFRRIPFATPGPMARCTRDLLLEFCVLAGADDHYMGKGFTLNLPTPSHKNLKDYRVLMVRSHQQCPVSTEVNQAMETLASKLNALGVNIVEKELPLDTKNLTLIYAAQLSAFVTGSMSEERYQLMKQKVRAIEDETDSISLALLKGFALSHRDWLQLENERVALCEQWSDLFKEYDIILMPVMSVTAFPHYSESPDERKLTINGNPTNYANQQVWQSFSSLLGIPATVAPIHSDQDKMPIGVQILGNYLNDLDTLHFSELLEEHKLSHFRKPSGF